MHLERTLVCDTAAAKHGRNKSCSETFAASLQMVPNCLKREPQFEHDLVAPPPWRNARAPPSNRGTHNDTCPGAVKAQTPAARSNLGAAAPAHLIPKFGTRNFRIKRAGISTFQQVCH